VGQSEMLTSNVVHFVEATIFEAYGGMDRGKSLFPINAGHFSFYQSCVLKKKLSVRHVRTLQCRKVASIL
jgi:hypothetical protein